jgi:transposase
MRFVPIKTQGQQTMLSLHRARAGLVKSRTALANQIRGLLGEFGIVLPQGIRLLGQRVIEALSNHEHELCTEFRTLIQLLVDTYANCVHQRKGIVCRPRIQINVEFTIIGAFASNAKCFANIMIVIKATPIAG